MQATHYTDFDVVIHGSTHADPRQKEIAPTFVV